MHDIKTLIRRIERLEAAVFADNAIKAIDKKAMKKEENSQKISFNYSLNIRAYAKRYMKDHSGPQKFALLLAYFAGGNVKTKINLAMIKRAWDKMKPLIGKFNLFYTNAAKTNGWVDSKEKGVYFLTNEWKKSYEK